MKLEHTTVDDDRVPSIHTALIPHHHIGGAAQEIGDFSFSFVTPLSADDDNIGQGHGGPKPQICTIREYFRSGGLPSKGVVFCVIRFRAQQLFQLCLTPWPDDRAKPLGGDDSHSSRNGPQGNSELFASL